MQLREAYPRLLDAGLRVVVIGMGGPDRTRSFRETLGLPFPVLSDPRRQSYAVYGLGRSQLKKEASLNKLAMSARRAVVHGAAATLDQDMRQLGGYFVVSADGTLLSAHPAERVADPVDPDALAQIAQLASQSEPSSP